MAIQMISRRWLVRLEVLFKAFIKNSRIYYALEVVNNGLASFVTIVFLS